MRRKMRKETEKEIYLFASYLLSCKTQYNTTTE